eukprot:Skav204435  [mRNA]  locus=scaffold1093:185902:191413:- [translate_table: standard]
MAEKRQKAEQRPQNPQNRPPPKPRPQDPKTIELKQASTSSSSKKAEARGEEQKKRGGDEERNKAKAEEAKRAARYDRQPKTPSATSIEKQTPKQLQSQPNQLQPKTKSINEKKQTEGDQDEFLAAARQAERNLEENMRGIPAPGTPRSLDEIKGPPAPQRPLPLPAQPKASVPKASMSPQQTQMSPNQGQEKAGGAKEQAQKKSKTAEEAQKGSSEGGGSDEEDELFSEEEEEEEPKRGTDDRSQLLLHVAEPQMTAESLHLVMPVVPTLTSHGGGRKGLQRRHGATPTARGSNELEHSPYKGSSLSMCGILTFCSCLLSFRCFTFAKRKRSPSKRERLVLAVQWPQERSEKEMPLFPRSWCFLVERWTLSQKLIMGGFIVDGEIHDHPIGY